MCQKNRKAAIGLPAAIFAMLLINACSPAGKDKSGETAAGKAPVRRDDYKTAPVKFFSPEYPISVPGELYPYEQVALHAKVTGFVKKLYADRGDMVRKGQLLAVLEAPEIDQRYRADQSSEQKMHSDYIYSRQAYERLLEASATAGAVAAIELERAKTAMESAKSAYEASKAGTAGTAQLQDYLRITAPFDGVVMQRNASPGALAGTGPGLPLFVLAQGSRLRLTLSLPEKHAASVRPGMPAVFTVSSQPGKKFPAKLSRTSGLLDRQDRSLTLEFDVDNASGELQGGDYAQVELKLQRRAPSYWVPAKSVLSTQMGTYVLTFGANEIRRIPVKEGIRLDSLTEVFGELSERDLIILKPSEEIKEGPVKPANTPL